MKQTEYFLTASNEEEAWEWVEAISAFTTDTVDTDATEEEAPYAIHSSIHHIISINYLHTCDELVID